MRLMSQHKDTTQLAQQIHHVLSFCHWAITTGSSTALLYSKRLVGFTLAPYVQQFEGRKPPVYSEQNGVCVTDTRGLVCDQRSAAFGHS